MSSHEPGGPTPPPYGPPHGSPYGPGPQNPYAQPEPPTQPSPQAQQQPDAGWLGGSPSPAPGGGGRGPFAGRRAVLVTALAVALLVVGGVVYAVAGGGHDASPGPRADDAHSASPSGTPTVDKGDGKGPGGGPEPYDPNAGIQPGEGRVWLRENQTQLAGSGAEQFGPWRVGDVVVKAMHKEITGYSAADGTDKWKADLETPICGVPQGPAANGKLVVGLFESNAEKPHCTQLQQIDLTTGKLGWKVQVPKENGFDTTNTFEMAITGDTVAVSRSAVWSGFSVTDGRKLFGTPKTGCSPSGFAGGSRLIGLRNCFDPKPAEVLEEVDPVTGEPKWSYTFEKGWRVGRVLSVDPLVVAALNSDKKVWGITAFTADGAVRSQSEARFGVNGRCNGYGRSDGLQDCPGAVVDGDTLYLAGGKAGTSLGIDDTDEVIAVDLANGQEKWHAAAPDKGRSMWPLAVEDHKVVVYIGDGAGHSGAMATLAPTGGAPQVFLQSPAAARGPQSVFYPHGVHPAWLGGRLFLLNGRVQGPEPEKVDHALLSFGK
ncbi:PQQ-binding-like beta-propeller repeat protein [Streptomyces sp. NPDC006529]|uniref:outer membrane protein assembly factor BamB family protein n=1 Tax=Streptomyces sp. NPDC006529 TaxID=3157177 RepID=UPI0033AD072F